MKTLFALLVLVAGTSSFADDNYEHDYLATVSCPCLVKGYNAYDSYVTGTANVTEVVSDGDFSSGRKRAVTKACEQAAKNAGISGRGFITEKSSPCL